MKLRHFQRYLTIVTINMFKFSVILPVYNGEFQIAKLLDSLLSQTYERNNFECIVVDNGSTDLTNEVVVAHPLKPIFLNCPKVGSYAARNFGIASAKYPLLAFTDADCILDKRWLESAAKHFLDDKLDVLWGDVVVFPRLPGKITSIDLLDQTIAFPRCQNKKGKMGYTANLFALREAFNVVGNFSEKSLSTGDSYWGEKALKSKLKVEFGEDVIVYHPARDFASFKRKIQRITSGSLQIWYFEERSAAKMMRILRRSFMPPVIASAKLLKTPGKIGPKVGALILLWYFKVISGIEFFRWFLGFQPVRD
jgi:glycosyltransferase involved in cell wall biosynthesis